MIIEKRRSRGGWSIDLPSLLVYALSCFAVPVVWTMWRFAASSRGRSASKNRCELARIMAVRLYVAGVALSFGIFFTRAAVRVSHGARFLF